MTALPVSVSGSASASASAGAAPRNAVGNSSFVGSDDAGYLEQSFNQLFYGDFSDDVTALGTGASIAAGLTGLDIAMDIRDVTANVVNWEWSWSHAGTTALNVVGVLPVVGAFKYSDEVGSLVKSNAKGARNLDAPRGPTRFVEGVTVVDRRTGNTLTGTVDLKPTLDRIKSGGSFPHRNDASVFQNRPLPGRTTPELPAKPPGYYTEYVHPTPGVGGPGPQRIVTGQGGEIYYTPDHYQTFIPINP